jgi:hypothetical protein
MLHVMRHHGVLGRGVRVSGEGALFVLIVVVFAIFLAHKVLWTLVLVCAAIVLVPANGLVDVAGREFIELLVVAEDDDCNVY